MFGAIRAANHLLGAAKVEIVMARVADRPTAITSFEVGDGLLGDLLAHGTPTFRNQPGYSNEVCIWSRSLCNAT